MPKQLWFVAIKMLFIYHIFLPTGSKKEIMHISDRLYLLRRADIVLFINVSSVERFLFLLLGPHGKGPQYHEIGRSMATLMTDEVRMGYILFFL